MTSFWHICAYQRARPKHSVRPSVRCSVSGEKFFCQTEPFPSCRKPGCVGNAFGPRPNIVSTRGEPVLYARFSGGERYAPLKECSPSLSSTENFDAPVIPTMRPMPERNRNLTTTIRTQLTSSRLNNAFGRIANPRPYLIAIHNPDGEPRINLPIVWRRCRWLT
jgi:hypothetical protein